jgi:hypothetical protein
VKAQATKRAMVTATRVASNNKGNGNGDKGCRQVTATRAMRGGNNCGGQR